MWVVVFFVIYCYCVCIVISLPQSLTVTLILTMIFMPFIAKFTCCDSCCRSCLWPDLPLSLVWRGRSASSSRSTRWRPPASSSVVFSSCWLAGPSSASCWRSTASSSCLGVDHSRLERKKKAQTKGRLDVKKCKISTWLKTDQHQSRALVVGAKKIDQKFCGSDWTQTHWGDCPDWPSSCPHLSHSLSFSLPL